jgi:DNA polymerase-3 subunit epsilon
MVSAVAAATRNAYGARPRPLDPRVTEEERAAHAAFIREVVKSETLWERFGLS